MSFTDRRSKWFLLVPLALLLGLASRTLAAPNCLDERGNPVPLDNEKVLRWKKSTPNQFLGRAQVSGVVQNIYPTRNGHYHFQIKIGASTSDTLELVYNISFGVIERIIPGQSVAACGDYITSIAPTQTYEPSPDGAILHWIHRSPKPGRHPSGYLILDGSLHGQGAGNHLFSAANP